MNAFDLETQRLWLETVSMIVGFSTNWIIQSTLLISAGLIIGRLMRSYGSAAQSLVYRTTLAAVLVCPLATWSMSAAGFSGYSVDLPRDWVYQTQQPVVAELPTSSAAAASDDRFQTETLSSSSPLLPAEMNHEASFGREAATPFAIAPQESIVADFPVAEDEDAQAPVFAYDVKEIASAISVQYFGVLAIAAFAVWLIVALFFVVRLAAAWRAMNRLRRQTTEADAEIVDQCRTLADHMSVPAPAVCCSPFLPSACLTGIRNPMILLPATEPEVAQQMPLPIRDVLIHELAHLRRHDCHWNLARQIATAVFFFQPLLWLLSRRLESTAEEVCDDYVVQFGGDRFDYADRLTNIAELCTAPVSAAGVGIVSLRSMLARRVARILDTSRSLSTRVGNFLLVIILAGGLIGTTAVALVGIGPQGPQADADVIILSDEFENEAADQTEPLEPLHFAGQVVDPDGNPAAGAKVLWRMPNYSFESTGLLLSDLKPVATTNEEGRFAFTANSGENEASALGGIVAVKEGFGSVWSSANLFESSGKWIEKAKARIDERHWIPAEEREKLKRQFLAKGGKPLKLINDEHPIRGQLSDIEGKPVVGAQVMLFRLSASEDGNLADWTEAARQPNADQYSVRQKVTRSISGSLARSLATSVATDADGRFTLSGVGSGRLAELLVSGPGIETTKVYARTENGEKIEVLDNYGRDESETFVWHPSDFTLIVGPSADITGTVRDAKTQKPLAGVTIKSQTRHGTRMSGWGQDFVRAITDDQGKYRLEGMPIGADNRIAAFAPAGETAYLSTTQKANTVDPQSPLEVDMELQRGVWVEGEITDKQTGEGISGFVSYYVPPESPSYRLARTIGADDRFRMYTDGQGRFKIAALPGKGYVTFLGGRPGKYPRSKEIIKLDGSLEAVTKDMYEYAPTYMLPTNSNFIAEIDPQLEDGNVQLNLQLDASKNLKGRVVGANGEPVKEFWYTYLGWSSGTDGKFEVIGYDPKLPRRIVFANKELSLAGQVEISGEQEAELLVQLQPAGAVKGRLVDEDGEPMSNYHIGRNTKIPGLPPSRPNSGANRYKTGDDGSFEFKGLVPGINYEIEVTSPEKAPHLHGKMDVEINLEPGEVKSLGDVRLVVKNSKMNDAQSAK